MLIDEEGIVVLCLFANSSCLSYPSEAPMSEVSTPDEEEPPLVDEVVNRLGLIRLSDVEPRFRTSDLHPSMNAVDNLQQELIFHFRLARMTWSIAHLRALVIGLTAFALGSISPETWGGGDPMIIGSPGIKAINGSGFFLLVSSVGLWLWFMFEIWNLFPIMKGHSVSLIFAWISIMVSMVLFHTSSPNFPFEIDDGNMLGGVVTIFVMAFIVYIFWKAVQETRDQHVQEVHYDPDPRKMEEAMKEHSLGGWTFILALWSVAISISSWAGVHYVADRQLTMPLLLVLHIATGVFGIYGLMHLLWFPQLMLGVGTTKVLSRRAREAIADLEAQVSDNIESVVTHNDGTCPECGEEVGINRSPEGDAVANCPEVACTGSAVVNSNCEICKTKIPSRFTCAACGINAPVMDFLSDTEAW